MVLRNADFVILTPALHFFIIPEYLDPLGLMRFRQLCTFLTDFPHLHSKTTARTLVYITPHLNTPSDNRLGAFIIHSFGHTHLPKYNPGLSPVFSLGIPRLNPHMFALTPLMEISSRIDI
ncbi:hypothetical protein LXL04_023760 [Taraxacum kok-saghyz]